MSARLFHLPLVTAVVFAIRASAVAAPHAAQPTLLIADGNHLSFVGVNDLNDVIAVDFQSTRSRVHYGRAGGPLTTILFPDFRRVTSIVMLEAGAIFQADENGFIPSHYFALDRATLSLQDRDTDMQLPSAISGISGRGFDSVLIHGRNDFTRGANLLFQDDPFTDAQLTPISVGALTPPGRDILSTSFDNDLRPLVAIGNGGSTTIYRRVGNAFVPVIDVAGRARLVGTDSQNNTYYVEGTRLFSTASNQPLITTAGDTSLLAQVGANDKVLVTSVTTTPRLISPDGSVVLLESTVTDGSIIGRAVAMNDRGGVVFATRVAGQPSDRGGELWFYDGVSSRLVADGFGQVSSLALTNDGTAYFWSSSDSSNSFRQQFFSVVVPEPATISLLACGGLLLARPRRRAAMG